MSGVSLHSNNNLKLRSVALVASVFVSLAAGTPYLYGVYGPQLVKQCGLNIADSATISLCTNIGAGFGGLPGGVLIDKLGPQLAILCGSMFIYVGYYGVYRIYNAAYSSLALICIFMCLMGFGSITSYFATLKAAQANFPKHRGSAGALPVSCYGLSATLMSIIAATFFNGNSGGFIGFLSLFCGTITFVGSWFVHVYLEDSDPEDPAAATIADESGAAAPVSRTNRNGISSPENEEAVLLLSRENSSSTLNDLANPVNAQNESQTGAGPSQAPEMSRTNSLHGSFSFWGIGTRTPRSSVTSIASSAAPLVSSLRNQYDQSSSRTPTISKQASMASITPGAAAAAGAAAPLSHRKQKKSALLVVWDLLRDKIFLLHYLIVSVLSGTGQMYIYTVGFIVIAQYHFHDGEDEDATHRVVRKLLEKVVRGGQVPPDTMSAALQALQVSIISISSFSGRLISGILSDYIYKKYHIQRLWIVLVTIIFLATGQYLLMVIQRAELISITSVIIGGSYGLVFGTYPAVIADGFGTKTFSTTWGLICTGPLITLFILNKYFGLLYDENTDPATGICYKGNECYRGAFELSFGLCFILFAVTLFVIYIQRKK